MGCSFCKARQSDADRPSPSAGSKSVPELPLQSTGINNTATSNKPECSAQGSATTIAVSGSPQSLARPDGSPMNQMGIKALEPEREQPNIRRLVGTAVLDEGIKDDRAIAGKPGYFARRNISMARVNLGSNNQLFDKYELTDEILGTGISGAVRVAKNRITGKKYAIKTLVLENITPKKSAMLRNEVEIYLKLDHPNIAKLIEVYEDEKKIFLVMELCTGRELYDRLAAKKRYSEGDAARVTMQMLEAINYCHKHNICHRDLKLENWVYSSEAEDAQLKLIDFGFSRIFNPVVPMTAMHGTVYYVSPEVMDGCYRERCDIWSIGVIVYMLLSGTPPFNGSADYQILIKIRTASYNFDAPVWQTISDEAKDFIRFVLVKDPNKRPSAEEALRHSWLRRANDTSSNPIDIGVLQAMRQFAVSNVLKRAAMGIVAYSYSNDEIEGLIEEFKKLDKQKTGAIRLNDLVTALTTNLQLSGEQATRIFEKMDQTGDNEVHYTEFLAATLHVRTAQHDLWIRQAFDRFDVDHQGFISADNLRNVLGDTFHGEPIEDMMARLDPHGNKMWDYQTFRRILLSPDPPGWNEETPGELRSSMTDAVVSVHMKANEETNP